MNFVLAALPQPQPRHPLPVAGALGLGHGPFDIGDVVHRRVPRRRRVAAAHRLVDRQVLVEQGVAGAGQIEDEERLWNTPSDSSR